MSKYRILFYAIIVLVAVGLACNGSEESTPFQPPELDQNNGLLVFYDSVADTLDRFVPDRFIDPIHKLADNVLASTEWARILCAHGPDADTLYRYYQRRLFHEDVFKLLFGQWNDSLLREYIDCFDSLIPKIIMDSADVFTDPTFITGYAQYLSAIDSFSHVWESRTDMNSDISSIYFQIQGNPILAVYSSDKLNSIDDPCIAMEGFIIHYYSPIIPRKYFSQIQSGNTIYFRYFDSTIHVMFPVIRDDPYCFYDITMILEQACIVD